MLRNSQSRDAQLTYTWSTLGRAVVSLGSRGSSCMWEVMRASPCQTQDTFLLWQASWQPRKALYLERKPWVTQIFVCMGEGMVTHKNCSGARAITPIRWLRQEKVLKWWVVFKGVANAFFPDKTNLPRGTRKQNFKIWPAILILSLALPLLTFSSFWAILYSYLAGQNGLVRSYITLDSLAVD